MSSNTTEGNQSYPHDESRTVSEITESFTEAIDAPEEAIEPFAELVGDMAQTIEQQSEELSALREENRELKDELKEERDTRAKEAAQDRQRIYRVEERIDTVEEDGSPDETPTPNGGETTMQSPPVEPQTDIESMVTMPEPVLEDQTANVRRAIFVGRDVEDYTTGCPAGRVIKSGELRRVLQAGTECNGHTQTVARVIDLLDRTGGEDTTVIERQGERRLVFKQDLVDRLSAQTQRCDSQQGQAV